MNLNQTCVRSIITNQTEVGYNSTKYELGEVAKQKCVVEAIVCNSFVTEVSV